MKNASKHGKQALATLLLFFGLLATSFSTAPGEGSSCDAPAATVTAQGSHSVSFSWNAVSGATGYRVWYVRQEDNFTSQETSTSGTSVNFSNLPSGKYSFYFVTDCGGETSEAIILDDLLMG
jgi:hypothetical protein